VSATLRASLAALAVAAIAAPGLSSVASGKAVGPTQPTLTVVRDCERFPDPYNSAHATVRGLPAFTPFEATLGFPVGNGVGPIKLRTDANGTWDQASLGFVGTGDPGIWTYTIVWSGGTLTQSLYIDCTKPASKQDCRNGGWRDFDFKNQGQCIRFVKQGPQRVAGL
jgi:hypothetical protein